MPIGDRKLSQKSVTEELSAMQLFTDREDPQEAFERKLTVINGADDSGVICYYGIGGVGKTALRNKLCHMINGDPDCKWRLNGPIDCDYAVFDFGEDGISHDRRTILSRIKEQLDNKGYSFFLFDMAMLMYAQKAGIVLTDDKSTSSILDKHPIFNSFFTVANGIPVIGDVTSAFQGIAQFLEGAHRRIKEQKKEKQYEAELKAMNGMEADEILKKLDRYFIMDMKTNMTCAEKPLVIFLDTYEKYIDTLNSDTLKITDDYWLWKGDKSVIQSIPGILWVILGREALTWEQGDEHWKVDIPECPLDEMSIEDKAKLAQEYMEQHLLGDLSEKDAIEYMRKAGVRDETLCRGLYSNITKGIPVYIQICIDQYKTISESRKPVLEDFGKDIDELITRYLRNMPDHYREMSYFLAVLGSWADEMVYEIAPKISCLHGFNKGRYADYVSHSFVVKKLDGTRYLHEVVKSAYLANAGEEIVLEVRERLDEWLLKEMKNDDSLEAASSVDAYIDNILKMDIAYDELYARWDDIFEGFNKLCRQFDFERLIPICGRLYEYIRERYPATEMERIVNAIYSYYLCKDGKIQEGERLFRVCFPEDFELYDSEDKNVYGMYFFCGIVESYAGHCKASLRYEKKAYEGLLRLLGEDHPDTISALHNLAITYDNLGDYAKSKALKEQVYEKRKKKLGEDHPDTITALNNLATTYGDLGDYAKSKALKEQVYEKSVRILGEDHPHTIAALNSLAYTYDKLGDYGKAKELFEQVYEKSVRILGEDHPDTISALHNLAYTYGKLGDYGKAKALKEQVYEKRLRILGEDHPDTITALNNLAITYDDLGDYAKSKALKEQVYEKSVRILGEDHPDTIMALNNLAITYDDLGDYEKAKELFEQVYEKSVRILGEDHPDTIMALHNLAYTYGKLGDYGKAKALKEQVYEKRLRILGEDHPDTISALHNLAITYDDLGDYEKAKELFEQVYEKRLRILGEDNPDTITALNNLATTYGDLGDYAKSKALKEQVYEKSVRILGEDHPDTITALNNLAITYDDLGDYAKSKALKEQVYEKSVRILGEDHPDTIMALHNLAYTYGKLGDYGKAKALKEQVYEKRLRILGEDHPDTISALHNLAITYDNLGDYAKSKALKEQVYEKSVRILGEDHPHTIAALNNLARLS